jgi:rifampicin phosphotransferase
VTSDPDWPAPGDGVWWITTEHFPAPVSRLFTVLFPPVTKGWERAAARYGLPLGPSRWAAVNSWYYFSPGEPDPATYADLETAALETLRTRRWRGEVAHWLAEERPAVVEANLALQAIDPSTLDDAGLRAHVAEVVEHVTRTAPIHFDHMAFDVSFSLLLELTAASGIDASEVAPLLAGASPATTEAADHVDRIAAALRDAGTTDVGSLEDVAAASPEARAALDDYLTHYGWRSVGGHEVLEVTLGEQPQLVLATIRRALAPRPPRADATPDPSLVRARLPEDDRAAFDELLADSRAAYRLRDDDVGLTYIWPMGLVRRAVLEAGNRIGLRSPEDLFEADPTEVDARLAGRADPTAEELADRTDRREAAKALHPPMQLGDFPTATDQPVPLSPTVARLAAARDLYWGAGGRPEPGPLRGVGVGTGSV